RCLTQTREAAMNKLVRGAARWAACGLVMALAAEACGVDPRDGAAQEADTSCAISENCGNCVYYARCRRQAAGKDLPHGLVPWAAKMALINSQTPTIGAVAIINTRTVYGHVAYVVGVDGDQITIEEGNYPSGHCGRRTGTREELHIMGFYD